jgi:ADP-heptose:LPS heptosyltransferase
VGLGANAIDSSFKLKDEYAALSLLRQHGWNGSSDLVILNPAGAFESRNWPAEHYIAFVKLWLQQYPGTQFLVLGVDRVAEKAVLFKDALGDELIDLTNKTTAAEAFAIVQRASFMLSEDSGLMHMGWVSGIPTLAMFGSTRSDWAQPLGQHTAFFDSSDLPCGNCMLEVCRYGDTHCLTRYTPEMVFERAIPLYQSI